jgi:hypothetical protein
VLVAAHACAYVSMPSTNYVFCIVDYNLYGGLFYSKSYVGNYVLNDTKQVLEGPRAMVTVAVPLSRSEGGVEATPVSDKYLEDSEFAESKRGIEKF